MDPRLIKLNNLLVEYSRGNYGARIELSGKKDEIDAFISSINMLGEELESTSISRNYFNDIFHSVSDHVFILNKKGIIENVNHSVSDGLGIPAGKLIGEKLDTFFTDTNKKPLFKKLTAGSAAGSKGTGSQEEILALVRSGDKRILSCRISLLSNSKGVHTEYVLTIRDVSQIRFYQEQLIASEEKYRNIFQASTDAIFISDENGYLLELNRAGIDLLSLSPEKISNYRILDLLPRTHDKQFLLRKLKRREDVVDFKTRMMNTKGMVIDCLISSTKMPDQVFRGYQGIIKNITKQEEIDSLILKTIIDTQEQERGRFAVDIHDGLGQQLSAVKFYIGTLQNSYDLPAKRKKEIIKRSNDAVVDILSDLRNICFNLMPRTLQDVNLKASVIELCHKLSIPGKLTFRIAIGDNLDTLTKPVEFAVFRIIQEFVNNAIKHGRSSLISIRIRCGSGKLSISLKDNGSGFKVNDVHKEGMGLLNVRSRVRSCRGSIAITSIPKKGSSYQITIPVN